MTEFPLSFTNAMTPVLPWAGEIKEAVDSLSWNKPLFEGVKVGMVIVDFYRFDSITTSAIEYAIVLNQIGCDVDIICNNLSGVDVEFLKPRDSFDPEAYDFLLYHYYIGDPLLDVISACTVPKVCFFQGITTPPESYLPYSPELYQICEDGLQNLVELCKFDLVLTSSMANFSQVQATSPCGLKELSYAIIPPVVSLSRFESSRVKTNKTQVNVLTVGRLFSSKNIEGVIRFSYELECKLGKKVSLTIAGSKVEPAYLSSILSVTGGQQPSNIVISLRPSDECLRELYNKSDVLASFSHHEGFCIPLVEAMAAELLVVSHNVTALPDTMKGTGVMVDGYDYKQAADDVAIVMNDDILIKRSIENQKKVYQNFYTEKVIIAKIIQIFEEFIGSHL